MSTENKIKVLLITSKEALRDLAFGVLLKHFKSTLEFVCVATQQEAFEMIPKAPGEFQIIVFENQGATPEAIKPLVELSKKSVFIMCTPDESTNASFQFAGISFDFASLKNFDISFLTAIKKHYPNEVPEEGDGYIILDAAALLVINPLLGDVFVKLRDNHYVRLFNKGDVFTKEDVEKYKEKKGIEKFYLKKEEYDASITAHTKRMEDLASAQGTPSREEVVKEMNKSTEIVRELVSRSGFTPQAQSMAKSSVAMSLKLLGSKPKLSSILTDLKKKDGAYITSHSMMLGQVACAMAHKVGWNSASTYFKLSMAAFIHDISLTNNAVAAVTSHADAKASGKFTDEQLKQIYLHPIKAAEYTLKFYEIPSDVDQIVAQHHERADGTGFPRGLMSKQISQLSALFIIAHEIIDFVEQNPTLPVEEYYKRNEAILNTGNFKKIMIALKAADEA